MQLLEECRNENSKNIEISGKKEKTYLIFRDLNAKERYHEFLEINQISLISLSMNFMLKDQTFEAQFQSHVC